MALYQAIGVVGDQKGKTVAFGMHTPTTADEEIVTGLSVVDHCGVSLAGSAAITHTVSIAEPASTAGVIRLRNYKPTATTNPTPIASSSIERGVGWWAVGDL